MEAAAALEIEKMRRRAREEEEDRHTERQRSEAEFQARLNERSDQKTYTREDNRLKLRAQLKSQALDDAHAREMDYVHAKHRAANTSISLQQPQSRAAGHTGQSLYGRQQTSTEVNEHEEEKKEDCWMPDDGED
jgi:hypothetical protein